MSELAWGSNPTQYFFSLTPELVLDAVEAAGFYCTGRCLAMNSLENRVYDVELEAEEKITPFNRHKYQRVVKFYRPGRWTEEQILDEHEFLLDLAENEIPVIAPEIFPDGSSLKMIEGEEIFYAVFPKQGGRAPEELNDTQLERIGRLLARLHTVGASKEAENRIELHPDTYGRASLEYLLRDELISFEFEKRYQAVVEEICDLSDAMFEGVEYQRIHGDCHLQNLLWSDQGLMLLDFDDMLRGPCVQDLWLLNHGRDLHAKQQLDKVIAAYETMRDFDRSSLDLIEPLRALRQIHFSAWIGKRWKDPAFPHAFPQYGTSKYWNELCYDLEQQLQLIQDLN